MIENFKWIPLLTVFLGGLSFHILQALVSHFLEIDMQWGSTVKEAEDTTFFIEIPKLAKKFKWTFIFQTMLIAMVVVFACFVPPLWRITNFQAIYPLCAIIVSHLLLPICLNPALMMFTW